MTTTTLYEKYRPRTFADVVGQPKAVKLLEGIANRSGFGGQAFWISGATGTGKTTLARIIAETVADAFFAHELVGRKLTPRQLDQIESDSHLYALGKGGRVWIINEAHGLSKPVIEQLLDFLEGLPGHCVVIFTTTRDGQEELFEGQIDAHPLLSRCIEVRLTNQGLAEAFAQLTCKIADAEGLNGQGLPAALKLVKRCHNNMRAALEAVFAGELMR